MGEDLETVEATNATHEESQTETREEMTNNGDALTHTPASGGSADSDAAQTAEETPLVDLLSQNDASANESTPMKAALAPLPTPSLQVAPTVASESTTDNNNNDTTLLLQELQANLQQQMEARAEAEHTARQAQQTAQQQTQIIQDLQKALEEQMQAKAEAENKARLALEQVTASQKEHAQQMEAMQASQSQQEAERTNQQDLQDTIEQIQKQK